ncbi:MAG: LamG domain-containing protein [Candidatus Omnitrophica bacterium]|nr:LamG domain-containing protein [Candidatus Omnitrophota bacterium]
MKRLYIVILMLLMGANAAWAKNYNLLNPRYGQSKYPHEHVIKCAIDTSKIGAVGGVVTNFPVLVDTRWITQYDSLESATDRKDVYFVSSTLDLLKFEREQGDKNVYWVKVPAPYTAPYFYMYYGNQVHPDGADRTNVWDANFVMVQHMADSTTSVTSDATSNGNIGTKKGANEPVQTVGQIGYAQTFDANNDYINCGQDASLNFGSSSFTISFLINPSSVTDTGFLQKGKPGSHGTVGMQIMMLNYAGLYISLKDNLDNAIGFTVGNPFSTGVYGHGALVIDRVAGTATLFINGAQSGASVDISSITGSLDVAEDFYIGYRDGIIYAGLFDELCISNTARSAAWIKAEYNSGAGLLLTYTQIK